MDRVRLQHTPSPETKPADRLTADHVRLVALLTFVAMFEGFDISLTSVVMPYAAHDFGVGSTQVGAALTAVGFGSILALPLIRLADRFGRRPVLLVAAAGFSICSLLTVLAPSLQLYAAIQLLARLLLVTQIALAYLIVSETLPPHLRGRWNGVLGACGSFGAAVPFLLIRWATLTPLGWRSLFFVGAAPLVALPFLMLWLRETPVFLNGRLKGAGALSARQEIVELTRPALRGRFVTMSLLWLILNFASGVSALFFTLYVVQERHWSPADLVRLSPGVMAGAFSGYLLSGFLMDLFGRRLTMTLFVLMIGGFTALCYSATEWWVIATAWVGLQATLGIWTTAFTLNSELFPTHLRAAANGWCNNLIGRWGAVLAPTALAAFTTGLGSIGAAATTLGYFVFLAIPLVWLALPETRAARLEENA